MGGHESSSPAGTKSALRIEADAPALGFDTVSGSYFLFVLSIRNKETTPCMY